MHEGLAQHGATGGALLVADVGEEVVELTIHHLGLTMYAAVRVVGQALYRRSLMSVAAMAIQSTWISRRVI